MLRAINLLWLVFISIIPIYAKGSGSLQPSSYVFLTTAALIFFLKGVSKSLQLSTDTRTTQSLTTARTVALIYAIFASYTLLVGLVWSSYLQIVGPMINSSFHIYNALILAVMVRLSSADPVQFLALTRRGFVVALMVCVAGVFYRGDFNSRSNGFFNNPNQLAYFCVAAGMVFFTCQKLDIGRYNAWLVGLSLVICSMSLSRAGILCSGIIFGCSVFLSAFNIKRLIFAVGALILVAVAIGSLQVDDKVQSRSARQGNDASINSQYTARGYDRIFENPEYILFGAGEGDNKRFKGGLAGGGGELHSSVGTLIFAYGILGLGCFLYLWTFVFRSSSGLLMKIVSIAPLYYGLTHNGLRASAAVIATMVIAIACGILRERKRIARSQRQAEGREFSRESALVPAGRLGDA